MISSMKMKFTDWDGLSGVLNLVDEKALIANFVNVLEIGFHLI